VCGLLIFLCGPQASIGLLFSISSVTYTLACPLIGILANRERFGPRPIIVTGLLLQLIGFLLIGPSPLLGMGPQLGMAQVTTHYIYLDRYIYRER